MPPFRLQYASNLFVDLHKRNFRNLVEPAADYLALCGNIGRPESPKTYEFLKYCSKNWKTVYWVPGPHEFSCTKDETSTYGKKEFQALKVANELKNVWLMNSEETCFHEHKLVLLGTTLWTDYPSSVKGQPEFETIYFDKTAKGYTPFSGENRKNWFFLNSCFLKERGLFWSCVHPDIQLVFLTHTLPTPLLLQKGLQQSTWDRVHLDSLKQPFGLELPIRAWIGGATGSCKSVQIGSNPDDQMTATVNGMFEYPHGMSKPNEDYNPSCVLEIDSKQSKYPTRMFPENLVLPPILSSLWKRKVSLGLA